MSNRWLCFARSRCRVHLLALLGAVSLSALSFASPVAEGATYQIPATIASDCSVDVTQPILTWIASVPNNSVLSFGSGVCYRIEGTLELSGRSGLDFEGHGSTFRALTSPNDQRAIWRVIDSTNIKLQGMVLDGAYANGGTYNPNLGHAHAIDLRGTSADIGNVTMSNVAGDCVYFGRGFTSALTRSSGTVHDSTCSRTGRNGIAVSAGNSILVQRVTTSSIGYNVFNVEPNLGSGWGANAVTFDSNTVGSFAMNVYSLVESASLSNQFFTNNRVVGRGLQVAIADPLGGGYRPQNVTISGNSSDTAQTPSAINVDHVDGLTITGNTVPMTAGAMAAIVGSCNLTISGNSYPGGSTQAVIYPTTCSTPAAPQIGSFTPTSGQVGTSVTLSGSGFTGATAVSVNGSAAAFTVNSSSQITLTVPGGASSGPIRVTTPGGTATSATSFTVTAASASAPTVSSFTPTSGAVGTSVTINGTGFTGATAVTFSGTAASFAVNSATQITATIPSGATTGPIKVTTAAGTATSSLNFTVTVPTAAPTISSFTPTKGPVGTRVTITGSRFTGATAVTFNGRASVFTVSSATQITATVPTGATSGPIKITTPGGTATSSTRFRVTTR